MGSAKQNSILIAPPTGAEDNPAFHPMMLGYYRAQLTPGGEALRKVNLRNSAIPAPLNSLDEATKGSEKLTSRRATELQLNLSPKHRDFKRLDSTISFQMVPFGNHLEKHHSPGPSHPTKCWVLVQPPTQTARSSAYRRVFFQTLQKPVEAFGTVRIMPLLPTPVLLTAWAESLQAACKLTEAHSFSMYRG